MKDTSNRSKAYKVFSMIVLIILALLFLFPLYWIVTGAFKTGQDIYATTPAWLPSQWTMDNFAKLFDRRSAPLFEIGALVGPTVPGAIRWLVNTVFMSVMAMLLTCLTASMAGYALAKKRFLGRGLIFSLIVCAMALPKQVILIPLLREMSLLHLIDTTWGSIFAVIFPVVGWPFGVFLMKQFSEGIPSSLLEAARIDGAGEIKTFMNVALPIIQPGIGALAIFTFINAWNEYPLQLIMLSKTEAKTIALGIAGLQSEMSNDFGLIMAGAALAAVPIIIVFLCFQKYFTQGITMGAVKG